MSFSPYSYAAKPRHGFGSPAAGDFDTPSYLSGGPGVVALGEQDYGVAWLAAVPLWAWATGAGTAAAGASYLYGKSEGAAETAAAAAAAQAQAAPPAVPSYAPVAPTQYYQPAPQVPTPAQTKITDQPWFWPVAIGGGLAALYILFGRRA